MLGSCTVGVLSLGWKVDVVGVGGYTEAHCDAMYALLERHGLLDTELVLAVAARQTAQNPAPLLKLLRRLPRSELLVWTGTGEPAILPGLVGRIRRAFASIRRGLVVRAGRHRGRRLSGHLLELHISVDEHVLLSKLHLHKLLKDLIEHPPREVRQVAVTLGALQAHDVLKKVRR